MRTCTTLPSPGEANAEQRAAEAKAAMNMRQYVTCCFTSLHTLKDGKGKAETARVCGEVSYLHISVCLLI